MSEATANSLTDPDSDARLKSSTEGLEIKDARLIFNAVWDQLELDYGHEQLRFPKEIILLGGAPGSGKGTNTTFIMNARGFTCQPIVVSELLNSKEAKAIKDTGGMVGDREVIGILLRKMLQEEFRDGAILDGFPRTRVQVECLKLLVEKINALHREFHETPLAVHFRKPTIHAMVLFVEESTSIMRQMMRGKQIAEHNEKVKETGVGELRELRTTDRDPDAAQHRYRVFKEKTWGALQSLREHFFYHFINAEGSFREVEQNILNELKYQSSLELDGATFDRLRRLPLASEIVVHARQDLVRRLDSYELEHTDLFARVADLIQERFMPIIIRHAISGQAAVNTSDEVFDDPMALAMLIDIFSERGYHARVDKRLELIPESVDLETGQILNKELVVYRIHIHFKGSEIRRG
ncbi:MAG: adenylate kinase [Verrucomicrobiales bacterium]|nr:adenylate kinase [Verrucomicrobiales bacterium]|tara:strand:- start:149 stop:1378 length:1230 start_codon:yes stop_codon:yes gene_type:complete